MVAVQHSQEPRIEKTRHGSYELTAALAVDCPVDAVFEFFSEATNLDVITPPWLQFRVLTPRPILMREGAVIDYSLRLHRFPVKWRSRIENWEPGEGFVDTQVRGPFRSWRHEHTFEILGNGRTAIRDRVEYRVPGGWPIHRLFVRRDLSSIFRYRQQKVLEIFS